MNKFNKIKLIFLSLFLNYNSDYLNEIINCLLDIKKISVIIPIYNTEKYLEECLNSVINQTFKNIEIICIDDGSTDNSQKIIEKFRKLDKRIISLKQKNKGSGISRNRGINISKGKYISFLDSDDMYYDNFSLEYLYNNAKNNKAIICGGGIEAMLKDNNKTLKMKIFDYDGFMKYIDFQYDYYYQRFIYNNNFLKIYRIYFPNYLRYQDPPFFIKAMFMAKRFYAIKNTTYLYRPNRPTHKKEYNLKQVIDMFYGIKDCLDLAEKFHLYKLYETSLNRLNLKVFWKGAIKFSENSELKKLIHIILKSINERIIKQYNLNFNINSLYKNYNYSRQYIFNQKMYFII